MVKIKKDSSENKKLPEKNLSEVSIEEKKVESTEVPTETNETKELTQEQVMHAREEIEKMDLDDSSKAEAQTQASSIKSLQEEEKIKKLLQVAKEKGVVFAVGVAKKMKDPYVLDIFHDTLAKGGYYKNFIK